MKAFIDRKHAGKLLAAALQHYKSISNKIILALPRGGIPVAYEVAKILQCPLDLCLVRKLGCPGQEELALGAIAYFGNKTVSFLNQELIDTLGISEDSLEEIMIREKNELNKRNQLYRASQFFPSLSTKTVILIDDGLATGATMQAAVIAVKDLGAKSIVVAIPVGADTVCKEFSQLVDDVVCLKSPSDLYSVGFWYENFEQITDAEVFTLLAEAEKIISV